MELVALVRPSKGAYPGHMAIGQVAEGREPCFFGFYFDPMNLPIEYRPPERWQEFLYGNKTLGEIRDDSVYVKLWREEDAKSILEKRASCEAPIEAQIPSPANWKPYANYSFRPDDFHSDDSPCYNCVTWATMIGNKLVPGFLTTVRQGRIKLIIRQLRAESDKTGDTNG